MQPWKIEREESEGIPPVVPYLNYYIAIIIIITLVMWKKGAESGVGPDVA